jgi:hypothetical protein
MNIMNKNPLLEIAGNIAISTTKTCILFMISAAANNVLRETTKNGNGEFLKGYRFIRNKYFNHI